MASVTGTAAFPARYQYGVVSDGGYQRSFTKEIKLDAAGADTAESVTNLVDAFGRTYKIGYPGATAPYQQSFYNNLGQLWKQRDPDGVVTLFGFNAKGERAYVCLDSNRNDVINFTGQDRITQTTNDVLSSHGVTVQRTRTYVWLIDGSATATALQTNETAVTGLGAWRLVPGGENATAITIPTAANNWTRTVTQNAPDGSSTTSVSQNGRPISVTRKDSLNTQLSCTTFGYDAHGRRHTVTDTRTDTTTYTFNNADQIVSVTTPPPGTGAPAQTTTTYFDVMGRATNVVQPDGTAKVTEYFLTGLPKKKHGSRDYPVEYTYDPQGRLKTMTTWTNFAGAGGAAVTTKVKFSRVVLAGGKVADAVKGALIEGGARSMVHGRDDLFVPRLSFEEPCESIFCRSDGTDCPEVVSDEPQAGINGLEDLANEVETVSDKAEAAIGEVEAVSEERQGMSDEGDESLDGVGS